MRKIFSNGSSNHICSHQDPTVGAQPFCRVLLIPGLPNICSGGLNVPVLWLKHMFTESKVGRRNAETRWEEREGQKKNSPASTALACPRTGLETQLETQLH